MQRSTIERSNSRKGYGKKKDKTKFVLHQREGGNNTVDTIMKLRKK
jgi:hypothetical protein